MPGTVVEKAVCDSCGVDVRKNTLFCYNCGSKVGSIETSITETEDLNEGKTDSGVKAGDQSQHLKIEPPAEADKKRAMAAAERRKARISPGKRRQVVWEPAENAPDRTLLLVSFLIAIIAGSIVIVTVLWK